MEKLPKISEMVNLTGKRALVTGGGKGIGAAISSRLVEAGAEVTIADVDPEIHILAEELSASFAKCDITVPEQLKAAVQQAADGSSLDILVNNAGVYPPTGPIAEVSDDFVTKMLDLNVRAQYSASREAVNYMNSGASIVNISSIAALRGGASITAYSTSKAAVIGLTKAFANELGPKKIRVNAISAGPIKTLAASAIGDAKFLYKWNENHSFLKRNVDIHDVGNSALYLLSDLASGVTGEIHYVDAGYNKVGMPDPKNIT